MLRRREDRPKRPDIPMITDLVEKLDLALFEVDYAAKMERYQERQHENLREVINRAYWDLSDALRDWGKDPRFISHDTIVHQPFVKKYPWGVNGDFVDQFEFLGAKSNHDVADRIRKGVKGITGVQYDPESSQFFANFRTEEEAHKFVDLVNEFLVDRKEALRKVIDGE